MSRLTKRNSRGEAYCINAVGVHHFGKEIEKLAHYEDLEEAGRLLVLPCKVGDELYRITYPYRQPPKVTKYRVKNFRTIKRGQKLQLEVQADCVPARNWMYFEDFYTTKAEAEVKLAEMGGGCDEV